MQMLLKQSTAAIEKIQQVFNLSDGEKHFLLSCDLGEGIFFAGANHVAIRVISSIGEHLLITSDPREVELMKRTGVSIDQKELTQLSGVFDKDAATREIQKEIQMPNNYIFAHYGLIGDTLDLKKNINLEIDQEGRIADISYNNPSKNIEIRKTEQNSLILPGFINSHVHVGDSFAKESGFNKDLIEVVAPPSGLKHELLEKTPKEIIIKGIRKAVLEMLSNGITTFIDFREGGIEGINLIKEALKEFHLCRV